MQPKRHVEPYAWLGASAVTLGLGAALVSGAAVATAQEGADGSPSSASSGDTGGAGSAGTTGNNSASPNTTRTGTTGTVKDDESESNVDDAADGEPDDKDAIGDDADDADDEDADDDADDEDASDDEDETAKDETDPPATNDDSGDQAVGSEEQAAGDTDTGAAVEFVAPAGDSAFDPAANTVARFALNTFDTANVAASFEEPPVDETAQLTSVPILSPLAAGFVKDYKDRLNPLVSAALGVYHLQTAVVELKTFHLPSAFLNLLNVVFSLSTAGLYLIPWGGWLSPIPAALGTATAYVNGIGKTLIPIW